MLFNSEDNIHFPNLTVAQTLHFALRNKTPSNKRAHDTPMDVYILDSKNEILENLGISHTGNTFVGNEYLRGVSGGERKQVSIAEMQAVHR